MKMSFRPHWATTISWLLIALLSFGFAESVYAEEPTRIIPDSTSLPERSAGQTLTVTPLNNSTVTVEDLVYKIVGSSVPIRNVHFTGANQAAGIFSGDSSIIGLSNGVVLSTGNSENVKGPNGEDSDNKSTTNVAGGDDDLNALLNESGATTDAAVLEFDFFSNTDNVTFQYLLASEEYNDYLNYHDVIGLFINGANQAWLPEGDHIPVSVGTVNSASHSQYFRNNTGKIYNTAMDGFTSVFSAQSAVTANDWNHVKIAIADYHDRSIDSNLLIKAAPQPEHSLTVTLTPAADAGAHQLSGTKLVITNGSDSRISAPSIAGQAVIYGVPAGTWTITVLPPTAGPDHYAPKLLQIAPVTVEIGTGDAQAELIVVALNGKTDTGFSISALTAAAQQLDDYNGDGVPNQEDIKMLLDWITARYIN